ncbi:hypothetical protein Z517_11716 [Fonsecaea pedrosoi CBS 271.37]|uniref:Uncharacterized protein n=1 Tax=Fonsecaea pedrosoi CBS 271.37 TaxID=1442368 RepID=A0A0D2G897_9EURO|nr:uncharacterized protein Z517_11716 [Fonsecaea pedrosoi CBS 271.37]KIW74945.1 hypothetical protein Z517_11716 [Fonsecaea pedrosoi CBS 271.37]
MTAKDYEVKLDLSKLGSVSRTIRKESIQEGDKVEVKYSWVRGSKTQSSIVFIAVLPGKWSLYSRHKGISMFTNTTPGSPFPGIESMNDIRGNRRWVLGVFRGISLPPKEKDFTKNAKYFECPGDLRHIDTSEFEAWQAVGVTTLGDNQIDLLSIAPTSFPESVSLMMLTSHLESQLWHHWSSGYYDERLWNSQNFVVYLAVLILEESSRQENFQALHSLHWTLWWKQEHKMAYMMTRRHLTAMAGMTIFGIATFGLGAVGSWAYGGYGIVEASLAFGARGARLKHLVEQEQFSMLRGLLEGDESE